MTKQTARISLTMVLTLFLIPLAAFAADLNFIAPLPGFDAKIPSLGEYFSKLYQFGLYIAIILGVVQIIYGGVLWSFSGAVDKKSDAKDRIVQALLGIFMLLASVLILNTLNPNLTSFSNVLPGVTDASNSIKSQ